jgi:hypothetical protein
MERPVFRGQSILLDDHLFNVDLKRWEASIATESGRIKLKLLHGVYHEKFRRMRPGEAWLVKRENGIYLYVTFSEVVEFVELSEKAIAIDLNENNATFGSEDFINKEGDGGENNKDGRFKQGYVEKLCGQNCWRSIGAGNGGGLWTSIIRSRTG